MAGERLLSVSAISGLKRAAVGVKRNGVRAKAKPWLLL